MNPDLQVDACQISGLLPRRLEQISDQCDGVVQVGGHEQRYGQRPRLVEIRLHLVDEDPAQILGRVANGDDTGLGLLGACEKVPAISVPSPGVHVRPRRLDQRKRLGNLAAGQRHGAKIGGHS